MGGKKSKRLVIDASVACSSGGEDATHPVSKHCRDFLKDVLEICHHIVMTPSISNEWDKHQSSFARQWRTWMASRKKIDVIKDSVSHVLRDKIEGLSISSKDRTAMLKDVHLVEAALQTDQIVISRDSVGKGLFVSAADNVGEIKKITWIDLNQMAVGGKSWLENGAKPEKNNQLGL